MAVENHPARRARAGRARGQNWIVRQGGADADEDAVHAATQLVDAPARVFVADPPGVAGLAGDPAVAPRAASPACARAVTSAWACPYVACQPSPTIFPSRTITAPTTGFGSTWPRPCSASSSARRIQTLAWGFIPISLASNAQRFLQPSNLLRHRPGRLGRFLAGQGFHLELDDDGARPRQCLGDAGLPIGERGARVNPLDASAARARREINVPRTSVRLTAGHLVMAVVENHHVEIGRMR